MERRSIDYTEFFPEVMAALRSRGLLLGSYDADRKPNAMTIGWGSLGSVWGVPMWMVFVRPSRHTYHCIEHSGCFTVNVPPESLSMACAVCGSTSGADVDKFEEAEITAGQADRVLAPAIDECPIVYECQVVHASDILPNKLADEILSGAYRDGDYHRVYCGKILHAKAAAEAERLLRE